MTRIIFITVSLFFFLKVQSQDSIRLFYISNITASKRDSIKLAQCKDIEYRGAIVKLLFLKNSIRVDSLSTSVTTYTKLNDSVILDILISQQLYDKSDSIVISPIHKFACKGARGGLSLKGEKKEIKNMKLWFISNPPGTEVYLIPKFKWESNPQLINKNENALMPYKNSRGTTPIWAPVQEYVYITLFRNNNQYIAIECSPTNKNPVDSVSADFIRK